MRRLSRRARSPKAPHPDFRGTAPRRLISASACDIANRDTWLVIASARPHSIEDRC